MSSAAGPSDPTTHRHVPAEPSRPDDPVTRTELAIARGEQLGWEDLVAEAQRRGRDPRYADLSDDALEAEVGRLAAVITAQTARWLGLLGELVIRGTWAEQGARTPGAWLSWKLGIGGSTAREHVRVALRLRDLPRVAARFAEGTLSYSKVRALTRVAPAVAEDVLLMWADHATAAQIDRIVRGVTTVQRRKAVEDYELNAEEDRRFRSSVRTHADGTATWELRGPADEIAAMAEHAERLAQQLVRDRLDDVDDECVEGAGEQGSVAAADDLGGVARPDPRVRTVDRVEAVGHALAAAADAEVPIDTSGLDRHTLVVEVHGRDLATRVEGEADVVPVRDAHGRLRAMDRRVLRRLACDAGVVVAVMDGDGSPLDLGRRRRRTTAALRRAVHLRDRCCTFPGCHATRHLDAHHVEPWSNDGPTDLSNLALVCSFHHRFVHDRDWHIEVRADGEHRFTPPGATEPVPAVGGLRGLGRGPATGSASAEAFGSLTSAVDVAVAADALAPPGPVELGGFDLDTAIAVLLQVHERTLAAA